MGRSISRERRSGDRPSNRGRYAGCVRKMTMVLSSFRRRPDDCASRSCSSASASEAGSRGFSRRSQAATASVARTNASPICHVPSTVRTTPAESEAWLPAGFSPGRLDTRSGRLVKASGSLSGQTRFGSDGAVLAFLSCAAYWKSPQSPTEAAAKRPASAELKSPGAEWVSRRPSTVANAPCRCFASTYHGTVPAFASTASDHASRAEETVSCRCLDACVPETRL